MEAEAAELTPIEESAADRGQKEEGTEGKSDGSIYSHHRSLFLSLTQSVSLTYIYMCIYTYIDTDVQTDSEADIVG